MGGGAPRERGRPARMLSRCVPLSFPAMRHPATLPAGTAWARPKQSPGAVAGRAGWRRWPRLCQDLCGRDARAPGWHHPITSSQQSRSIGLCVFVPFVAIPGKRPATEFCKRLELLTSGCSNRVRGGNLRRTGSGPTGTKLQKRLGDACR